MKAIKSLFFNDVVYTKVEYVKNDTLGEKFHVYKSYGVGWEKIDARKTLEEALELANKPEKVRCMGIYEGGVRKGMLDWKEPQEKKQIPAPLPYVLPADQNVEFERRPKTPERKRRSQPDILIMPEENGGLPKFIR